MFAMKRSMTVSLVLLGSAAVSLSGCKPKADGRITTNRARFIPHYIQG
jgi:hypothetical protein